MIITVLTAVAVAVIALAVVVLMDTLWARRSGEQPVHAELRTAEFWKGWAADMRAQAEMMGFAPPAPSKAVRGVGRV